MKRSKELYFKALRDYELASDEVLRDDVIYCTNARQNFKDGKGLFIYGNTGMGKTHISACMANDLLEQGYKIKFTNINRIID